MKDSIMLKILGVAILLLFAFAKASAMTEILRLDNWGEALIVGGIVSAIGMIIAIRCDKSLRRSGG